MDGHFCHWMLSLLVGAALVACGDDSPVGGGGTGGGAAGHGGAGGAGAGGEGGDGASPPRCEFERPFDPSVCPSSFPSSCVVHVDGSAEAPGDGSSWDSPMQSVQAGVDLARCGVLGAASCDRWQVWVKAGVYYIHQGCMYDAVRLREGVDLYGGFAGLETELDERDVALHETILDGRDGPLGRVARVERVVLGSAASSLDGFTVRQGRETGEHPFVGGAGMLLREGGAVRNCTFRDNVSYYEGGAIAAFGDTAVVDSLFENNQSSQAGGAIAHWGDLLVSGSAFRGNEAEWAGGAIASGWNPPGGSLTPHFFGGHLVLEGSRFEANEADSGGAVWVQRFDAGGEVEVFDCHFESNFAVGGGAMYLSSIPKRLERSRFLHNTASGSAGALHVTSHVISLEGGCGLPPAEPNLVNLLFHANVAPVAGALSIYGGSRLDHCTFAGNLTLEAEGAVVESACGDSIANSILWNPTAGPEVKNLDGTLTVTHSLVRGGHAGEGNLDVDPLFVDLDGGDLHLSDGSACIDAADPASTLAVDLEGNPRSELRDMGALEHP